MFVLLTICLEVYVDELIVRAEISLGCVAIELFICNIGFQQGSPCHLVLRRNTTKW